MVFVKKKKFLKVLRVILNPFDIVLRVNLYFHIKQLWGQRICGPGPLYIRAQGLSRGELLPRTHNESPKKAQGKDELSARAGQVKKLPIQQ